ncbi:MAG: hypothetical protein SO102_06165 [Eubacteriales bacterium]|mgnify:FL=1|jgi:hypothetical protein|nr:hypothetical protein [Eubacteriales bacterium]
MKYEDIDNVENQIINNDYVSYDVKPARKSRQFFEKLKGSFNKEGTGNLLILPLMALTAISLGFLIAQIAKYASIAALTSILT